MCNVKVPSYLIEVSWLIDNTTVKKTDTKQDQYDFFVQIIILMHGLFQANMRLTIPYSPTNLSPIKMT